VLDVCICVDDKLISNRYFSYRYTPILMKLGTHVLYANMHKSIQRIFVWKFLVNF